MHLQLRITPSFRLICEQDGESAPSASEGLPEEAVAQAVIEAFAESSASGLLCLTSPARTAALPLPLVFWRNWGRRVLQGLAKLDEQCFEQLEEWVRGGRRGKGGTELSAAPFPEAPDAGELTQIIDSAPPMRGLEYLTVSLLQVLWREVLQEFAVRAGRLKDGCRELLQTLNPDLHLLGRVTLHLVENKRDEDRPFAFLATWASRLSNRSQVQHIPLAEALRHFAAEQDQQALADLLVPVREAASRCGVIETLLSTRAIFRPQAWTADQAWEFLRCVPEMEQSGLSVRVPDWWSARRTSRPAVRVRIGNDRSAGVGLDALLDFSVELAIDGVPLTGEERSRLLSAGEGLLLLRGKWVEVDPNKLAEALQHWQSLRDQHADGITLLEGMRMLAGTRLQDNEDRSADSRENWSGVIAGEWLSQTLKALREPESDLQCRPGDGLAATLRPYQAAGVRWLWQMQQLGLGACLADDMGLGKTIQVIDLILRLKAGLGTFSVSRGRGAAGRRPQRVPDSGVNHVLLVVPASLLGNWKQELERFAPQLRVLVAHRSECLPEYLEALESDTEKLLAEWDVVVTTYQTVRQQYWPFAFRWRLVVLDEAQAIRNPESSQSQAVRRLQSVSRIALTGTPVENHLGDLWALFDFCNPGLLGNQKQFSSFVRRISRAQDGSAAAALRRLVRPCILRRMKTDPGIAPDLPDKTEVTVECGLSPEQAAMYQRIVDEVAKQLKKAGGMQRRGLVLSMLMRLKQLCNHPSLMLNLPEFDPQESGKFQVLQSLCEPIAEQQGKVLVFTQFQAQCEPLAQFLQGVVRRPGLVLHGQVPVGKRKQLVQQFQEREDIAFFVISVKAGGTGLNLTAASHVIHFDRWWNPAVENQATDRAFRIGQKCNVLVQKFVCRGTLEERIDQMIRDKQAVASDLLGDGAETLLTEMSDRELMNFVALDLSRAELDD
ncbi:MAG: DEAD/DEAH box helicase [Planctomycetota bacterium]